MQTFLPYGSFSESAAVLDRQRLGKQRVENLQIMKALAGQSKGWQNHPAVRMWRGHETALMIYQTYVCLEWTSRGYKDTCRDKTVQVYNSIESPGGGWPDWLGDHDFHKSHRLNLIRKDPAYYGSRFTDTEDPMTAPYVWPV